MPLPTFQGFGNNLLLAALHDDERVRLAPYLEELELPKSMTLCLTGLPIAHAVFPYDAVTSTVMELPEGETVEVGLMGAEGVVGLDLIYGARDSVTTVLVQVAGRGARIAAEHLVREVVDRPTPFYRVLLRYSRVFYGMVAQSGACNASHGLEQRLARWLLMVHDRVRRKHFPLTHEFIAYMLGVRRATVTQAASSLRMAGAIEYERGEVTISDRAKLELLTCGCYYAVRELERSMFAS